MENEPVKQLFKSMLGLTDYSSVGKLSAARSSRCLKLINYRLLLTAHREGKLELNLLGLKQQTAASVAASNKRK